MVGVLGEQLREHGDEHGAGDGAAHGPQTADDDHGEVVDGQGEAEVVGDDPAEGQGQQHPGEPGVHGGHHERGGPEPGGGHAEHRRGDGAVAQRPERPARSAAHQVAGHQERGEHRHQPQVPEPFQAAEGHAEHDEPGRVVGEGEAAQGQGFDGAAVVAPGDLGQAHQQLVSDEDQRQGRQSQVHAVESTGDGAEQAAGDPGEQDGQHRRGPGRQPEAARPGAGRSGFTGGPGVAVGADGEEEGVAEGELAGHPGQQGQPDRAHGGGHREQARLHPGGWQVQRQHEQGEQQRGRGQCPGRGSTGREALAGRGGGRGVGDRRFRHGWSPSLRADRSGGPAAPAA